MMSGEVIAKEMIKPSSPTPPHLRKLQLSYLNQLAPPVHIGIILYYQASHHHHDSDETSQELKQSLSDALAVYYPLAGRLRDDYSVDCNDAGAEYVEARFSDVRIVDVVENPRTEELQQYLPTAPSGGGDIPLAVQVSFFGCSGIAIGVCISHRISDAMSMVAFVKRWAAVCRGDAVTIAATQPCFDLASRFPPQVGFSPPQQKPPPPQKIVTRRLIFDAQKIEALRNAASGPLVETPTKVEAVTAFIWSHFIEALKMKDKMNGKTICFSATHAVDVRTRASPPLPENLFGNANVRVTATAASAKGDYYSLAVKLREVIGKTNADYIRKFEEGEKYKENNNNPAFNDGKRSVEMCRFTSWSRLPFYEVDYGWGKPVWASITGFPVKNMVVLLGTKSMDGVEAWVNMVEEDIAVIESNYHLLHQVKTTANMNSF